MYRKNKKYMKLFRKFLSRARQKILITEVNRMKKLCLMEKAK